MVILNTVDFYARLDVVPAQKGNIKFMKNNSIETKVNCQHSTSSIIINDEYPHGMSAIADGYDFECAKCRELVNTQYNNYLN